jgi:ribonuclease HII
MIIGIDEVGRGCWAGPLVAAAVGLESDVIIPELTDSKLLSAKKRIHLTGLIQQTTKHIGIGWVWPREINKLGLTQSVRLAMQRAYDEIAGSATEIIIDGNYNFLDHVPNTEAVVKADGTIQSVSAASVIAKVARDAYMTKIALKYPEYGFESHVGYGTAAHSEALRLHGVLPIHRINYKPIQKLLAES